MKNVNLILVSILLTSSIILACGASDNDLDVITYPPTETPTDEPTPAPSAEPRPSPTPKDETACGDDAPGQSGEEHGRGRGDEQGQGDENRACGEGRNNE